MFMVLREDAGANTAVERTTLGDGAQHFRGSPTAMFGRRSGVVTGGAVFVNGLSVPGATVARPKSLSVVSVVTTNVTTASVFGTFSSGSGFSFWWGDLAELVIYDRALDTSERQQIETYLKAKYLIP